MRYPPAHLLNRLIQGLRRFPRQAWVLVKETFIEWNNDNASLLGAALAFYTIFSLAPILIIIVAMVGFFLGKEWVDSYILGELTKLVGESNAAYVMATIHSSYLSGSGFRATLVAISLMLIGATTVGVVLKNALNTIWQARNVPSGIWQLLKNRLVALLTILFAGIFLFLSMVITAIISATNSYIQDYVHININFLGWSDICLSIILLSLLFTMLYKVIPDVELSWKDVWVGGAITALLFTLGKYLLGLYLALGTVSSAYGAAGSLVVILLWVYYSSQLVFLGAEFTKVYSRRLGSRVAAFNQAGGVNP